MRVLLIEDDKEIVECVKIAFRIGWNEVEFDSCDLGVKGLRLVKEISPDMVILDLGLPDMSGYEVLECIRSFSDVPVIILTARHEQEDIVRGLDMGADDYMVKPVRQMELLARVKANIRKHSTVENLYKQGPYLLDVFTRRLRVNERWIDLTPTETALLHCLLCRYDEMVSYEDLAQAIWNGDYEGSSAALQVYVHRLREKIMRAMENKNEKIITTISGKGYKLIKTW